MKNFKLFLVLLVPAIMLLNSCEQKSVSVTTAEINMDSVRMEIEGLEAAYATASNARNADGVAAYYASDAQSLAADEPTRVGTDAIKAGIQKDFEKDTMGYTVSFAITGLWAYGDYATETGTSTVKDKDGKVVRTGKYMTLFEKRDGKYVAIRDIWNDDAPSATASSTPVQ